MKKILVLVLLFVMCFTIVSCGQKYGGFNTQKEYDEAQEMKRFFDR